MKTYDIAAYIWPSYTGKELRSRIFWPNGIGEWQTVQKTHEKENGTYKWERKPVWGYVDEADPAEMHRQIEEATRVSYPKAKELTEQFEEADLPQYLPDTPVVEGEESPAETYRQIYAMLY